MEGLKRNQRYFIKGEGEANEEISSKLDDYLEGFMTFGEKQSNSIEKTAEEKKLIEWIITEVGKEAEFYGAKPYSYNPDYFHIILDETMNELRKKNNTNAIMITGLSGVLGGEKDFRNNDALNAVLTIVHECFHLFSLNKVNFVEENGKYKVVDKHRSGIRFVHGPKANDQYKPVLRYDRFFGLNEAITHELTRLFYGRVIRKSEKFRDLVDEFDRKNSMAGFKDWQFPEIGEQGYAPLVWLFIDICDAIKKIQPEKYPGYDSVRDEFFKIYFNGDIKDLKPLLDIIGREAFIDLTDIDNSYQLYNLEKIKKFREKFGLRKDNGIEQIIKLIREEKK